MIWYFFCLKNVSACHKSEERGYKTDNKREINNIQYNCNKKRKEG